MKFAVFVIVIASFCFVAACNPNTNDTREKAAKATSELKQEAKQAGVELKKGAEEARKQGTAVAEGVRQGWKQGDIVDINSASKAQLESLPGINSRTADQIVGGRRYGSTHELVTRRVISEAEYQKIQDHITAK